MEEKKRETMPAYRKIALEIAKGIAQGKYYEGQRLSGRTVLSSQFNVSPETIRKATHLLKDLEILNIEKNSGVVVVSIKEAKRFVDDLAELQSVNAIKDDIVIWAGAQEKEIAVILKKIKTLVSMTERLRNQNMFMPFEIQIPPDSPIKGQTISELNFWHKTGATIIAIIRGETTTLSPGPYASLQEGDIIYIIGDEEAFLSTKNFVTLQ